jgi:hypothetical protein
VIKDRFSRPTTRYFLLFAMVVAAMAIAVLSACTLFQKDTPTAAPSVEPAATTAVAEAPPTTTVPPVQTPTIALPPTPAAPAETTPLPPPPEAGKAVFARFEESPVEVVPAVYHEPIAPDLSNVTIPFALSEGQLAMLAGNGFVVSPGARKSSSPSTSRPATPTCPSSSPATRCCTSTTCCSTRCCARPNGIVSSPCCAN